MSRLFLDSPKELEKRIDRMVDHFRTAEYLFYQTKSKGIPNPRELIWLLFQDAMRTARNTPFTEIYKLRSMRSALPDTRVSEADAFATKVARLSSGMSQYDDSVVRSKVNETDLDRMVDVLDLLRFAAGEGALRRRRVVLARAAGLTNEQCARIWDRFRVYEGPRQMAYVVYDAKQRVIGDILQGMDRHFALARTSRGFRRLSIREIERRKRAKKAFEKSEASNDA